VIGGAVHVRVGATGAVVGLTSSWRPVSRVETVPLTNAGDSSPMIVYWLGDENDPQRLLAPYYLRDSENTLSRGVRAASAQSKVVELGEDLFWPQVTDG
jgi:hypothetical protein